MLAVGLHDGNIAVYNLQKKGGKPVYMSDPRNGKHKDVVWQVGQKILTVHKSTQQLALCLYLKVKWAPDNLDGYLNFYSVSADGRVTNWTLVKTGLWYNDLLYITFNKTLKNIGEEAIGDFISGLDILIQLFSRKSWMIMVRQWTSPCF